MDGDGKPRGRPARPKVAGAPPDTRMDKALRVLAVLEERRDAAGGPRLDRTRLAEAAGVTPRNLDAILKSLRAQKHAIRWDESRGYWLDAPPAVAWHARTPDLYRSLLSLRAYVSGREELVERESWLRLLDEIVRSSEETRVRRMGRDFEEARMNADGVSYRVSEPEILYLNVHRSKPTPLTRSHLANLREAIRGNHPVRMAYTNRLGIQDSVQVEPYFLFHREGTFYLGALQTHSGGQPLKSARFKPFTITAARCQGVDVLRDRAFTRQARFEAARKLTRTGIRGPEDEAPVEAEFDVHGRFTYNACESEHGEDSRSEWVSTGPNAQQLRIRATFGSQYDLVRYLLSFGQYAEVRRPEAVRAILVENILGLARRYGLEVAEPSARTSAGSSERVRRSVD